MLILFNFRYGNIYLSTLFNDEDLWLSGYFEEIKWVLGKGRGCVHLFSFLLIFFQKDQMLLCVKYLLQNSLDMWSGIFLISSMLFNFTSFVNVNFKQKMRMQCYGK